MTTPSNTSTDAAPQSAETRPVLVKDVDVEARGRNERRFTGIWPWMLAGVAIAYSIFHLLSLNAYPLETWNFRMIHIAGALAIGFVVFSGCDFASERVTTWRFALNILAALFLAPALYALWQAIDIQREIVAGSVWNGFSEEIKERERWHFGVPLVIATGGAIVLGWFTRVAEHRISVADVVLVICGAAVTWYLVVIFDGEVQMRQSTNTPFAPIGISFAAIAGTALIMELARRLAGLALVIITALFLVYTFLGPFAPEGSLFYFRGLSWERFFSQVYTDAGILGPTTAVSSTYIILFIIFAAFLQSSKVGDYFVNFAFAAAGWARGGPAKVGIFASGLMGMINGTSAGNVVATGSLTIPLMKRVGYSKRDSGAVEAAASTGGQIMPPIMGAGAFIMAEITGIPYQEIAVAAIIPAVLYFVSVYFMVDFTAAKQSMRGIPRAELPRFATMLSQLYLFLPIVILIVALFVGYSVIRAGTLAMICAIVVSWLSPRLYSAQNPARQQDRRTHLRQAPADWLKLVLQIGAVAAAVGIIIALIPDRDVFEPTGLDQGAGWVSRAVASLGASLAALSLWGVGLALAVPTLLYGLSGDAATADPKGAGSSSQPPPLLQILMFRLHLLSPLLVLVGAVLAGHTVVAATLLALLAAIVVAWLSPGIFTGRRALGDFAMGPVRILQALRGGAMMSIQIIAVCACAGIIVGVISITGVGGRVSGFLLDIAENNQLIALVFAMIISMFLGMGMPTTAAYAVAASVVAPGLVDMGIDRLTAHFFVFYYAVVSAITPPVALASYAAAGISGANPMGTSVASFRIGLAAYIVPFMFFFAPALLMNDVWYLVLLSGVTATVGVFFLAAAVVGWFLGAVAPWWMRVMLLIAAICFISGDLITDAVGLGLVALATAIRRFGAGVFVTGRAD